MVRPPTTALRSRLWNTCPHGVVRRIVRLDRGHQPPPRRPGARARAHGAAPPAHEHTARAPRRLGLRHGARWAAPPVIPLVGSGQGRPVHVSRRNTFVHHCSAGTRATAASRSSGTTSRSARCCSTDRRSSRFFVSASCSSWRPSALLAPHDRAPLPVGQLGLERLDGAFRSGPPVRGGRRHRGSVGRGHPRTRGRDRDVVRVGCRVRRVLHVLSDRPCPPLADRCSQLGGGQANPVRPYAAAVGIGPRPVSSRKGRG